MFPHLQKQYFKKTKVDLISSNSNLNYKPWSLSKIQQFNHL